MPPWRANRLVSLLAFASLRWQHAAGRLGGQAFQVARSQVPGRHGRRSPIPPTAEAPMAVMPWPDPRGRQVPTNRLRDGEGFDSLACSDPKVVPDRQGSARRVRTGR